MFGGYMIRIAVTVQSSLTQIYVFFTFSPCTLMTFIFKRPTHTQLFLKLH